MEYTDAEYYYKPNGQPSKLEVFGRAMLGMKPQCKSHKDYMPAVTVVIPAYNEENSIKNTILAIKKQTYSPRYIIVVDDCSVDRTGEIARSLGAIVIRTEKNTGSKSKAVNTAIEKVRTPVFIIVDADTVLDPMAIEKVLPGLGDGKTLSVCGVVLPQVVSTFWERARLIEYIYGFALFKSAQDHWKIPLVSSGCFSAFNTSIFNKVGKFPENNIAEDMGITWNGEIMGYNVKYVPEAVCHAKDPEDWQQFKGQVLRWYRGLFQCIKAVGWDLFKKPTLAFFVLIYTALGLSTPILYALFIYFVYNFITQGFDVIGVVAFSVITIEIGIGFIAILIKGWQLGKLKQALVNYPLLWIISPINSCLYIYSFYKECIARQHLNHWDKGH